MFVGFTFVGFCLFVILVLFCFDFVSLACLVDVWLMLLLLFALWWCGSVVYFVAVMYICCCLGFAYGLFVSVV